MAFYLITYMFTPTGGVDPTPVKQGPFYSRDRAEEAAARALGSGKWAKVEITGDVLPG